MRRFFLLLFSIGLLLPAKAQDLSQTFMFAKELENRQDYNQALLTYHRVLFFDEVGQYREQAYRHMGTCYFALQNYEQAATYFDLAYFSEKNDSIKLEVLFQKTSSLLLNQNFDLALVELLNLPDLLSPYFTGKRDLYSAIAYFGMQDFQKSKSYFQAVIGPNHPQEQQQIEQAFVKIAKIEKVSPKKARILSTILPGLGQVYAGDIKSGINSLALTMGFVVLAYQASLTYSIIDAVASVAPWYQRYYMGGFMRAEQIAIDRKKQKRSKVYGEIMAQVAKVK